MKKLITTSFAFAAMLALVSPLYATGNYGKESDKAGSASATGDYGKESEAGSVSATGDYGKDSDKAGATSMSAEELEGMKVVSQSGEEIGEIQSAKTDLESGNINFVTISKGGVLGMGGEDIAIPFEALNFDQQNEQATLTVNESKLDNAPQQANMSDEEFKRNLESHYGVAPAFEGESNQFKTDPTRSMDQNQMETDPTRSMDQNQMESDPTRSMDPSQPNQPGMNPTPQTN